MFVCTYAQLYAGGLSKPGYVEQYTYYVNKESLAGQATTTIILDKYVRMYVIDTSPDEHTQYSSSLRMHMCCLCTCLSIYVRTCMYICSYVRAVSAIRIYSALHSVLPSSQPSATLACGLLLLLLVVVVVYGGELLLLLLDQ